MKIDVKQVLTNPSSGYPYTHRIEIITNHNDIIEINDWLYKNNIPHTQTGLGVYYLRSDAVQWFVLRWS